MEADKTDKGKAARIPLKPHIIDYKSFKTDIGTEYANYAVIGAIQPYTDRYLQEYQAMAERRKILPKSYPFFKDSRPLAIIKARSFEEAFQVYYRRAILPFQGGIGNVKEFLPKKRFLLNKNTYYNGTTYIQKLKANPNEKEFKIALIDFTFLFLEFDGKPLPTNHPLNPIAIVKRNKEEKKIKDIDKDEE
jgi:hypothetical protein